LKSILRSDKKGQRSILSNKSLSESKNVSKGDLDDKKDKMPTYTFL